MTQPLNRMRQNEKNLHKNRPCKRAFTLSWDACITRVYFCFHTESLQQIAIKILRMTIVRHFPVRVSFLWMWFNDERADVILQHFSANHEQELRCAQKITSYLVNKTLTYLLCDGFANTASTWRTKMNISLIPVDDEKIRQYFSFIPQIPSSFLLALNRGRGRFILHPSKKHSQTLTTV